MNLKNLRAFLHVMDEGALVAASEKMHLSQPAVSRLIHLLEEEVGTKLFYRDQKTLAPTPEAELFYPEAQRVIAAVDDFPELFRQLRTNSLVPLRIISQMRSANGLVIPALVKFAHRFPEIRTTLDIHPRRELGRRVQQDKFDLGVYVVPMQVVGVELVERRETRLHVLLPKGHPLAERPLLTPADMENERYVALRRGLMAREAVDRALARSGDTLEIFHEVSSTNAALRMVAGGIGFTFSDPTVLDPGFREKVVLVPWEPEIRMDLGLYAPKNQSQHEATSDFVACLHEVWDEQVGRSGPKILENGR
ncbi:LysR family transcriptional regulator [Aliiroseovarius sp.]|uniref:LysR family transcriptional regulator n=1 Tax=Aliiroseovarius sp. TaxID=1872442 RepID=UPI003BA8C1AE